MSLNLKSSTTAFFTRKNPLSAHLCPHEFIRFRHLWLKLVSTTACPAVNLAAGLLLVKSRSRLLLRIPSGLPLTNSEKVFHYSLVSLNVATTGRFAAIASAAPAKSIFRQSNLKFGQTVSSTFRVFAPSLS